ncbi:hypothetical protein F0562_018256 [Nyssa sinensis]|uniref:Endonuclease/exonuclease/phosphatase domain-containing protein n=1 Tax=Nyssa sinensis TaxID=561372 RepID=A0A5J4ZC70_9ASTE|nr:hypothetical protein F0562_018256 [Nyssa sinensis]
MEQGNTPHSGAANLGSDEAGAPNVLAIEPVINQPSNLRPALQNFSSLTDDQPWIVLGDFNVVRNLQENQGGRGLSDHSPALCQIDSNRKLKSSPFRFYNHWVEHKDFLPFLLDSWHLPITGNPMLRLNLKLKRLKRQLKGFNSRFFSNVSTRVTQAKEVLRNIQTNLYQDPQNHSLLQDEKSARIAYAYLSLAKEAYFHQKSRIRWLNLAR